MCEFHVTSSHGRSTLAPFSFLSPPAGASVLEADSACGEGGPRHQPVPETSWSSGPPTLGLLDQREVHLPLV